ncbi:MAG: lipocalin family protein [Pseudomonadales bacterium]
METVENLDLDRFMGQWHVLADISTPFDRDAFAPLETYQRVDDNVVETIYSYREGAASGPIRERHLKAFVSEESTAIWAMQIFWPIKAEYRVVFVDPDYQTTIVGRSKRDFVWVMSRDPDISSPTFDALLKKTQELGYDLSKLRLHKQSAALNPPSVSALEPPNPQ